MYSYELFSHKNNFIMKHYYYTMKIFILANKIRFRMPYNDIQTIENPIASIN